MANPASAARTRRACRSRSAVELLEARRLFAAAPPGQLELISTTPAGNTVGNSAVSGLPAASDDGRYVVFTSYATDLDGSPDVPDPGDGLQLAYVRDRVAGTTQLVSVGTDGRPRNAFFDP